MKFALFCLVLIIMQPASAQEDQERQFNWSEGPGPTHAFRYHLALSHGGQLYAVGGDNSGAIERYDPEQASWTVLNPMPETRLFTSGAVLDHSIYVIGGLNEQGDYVSTVYQYEIPEGKWKKRKPLNTPRSRLASVSCNGWIYAIGGLAGSSDVDYKNTGRVEKYDPDKDSWVRVADMPTPRHGHSAILAGNTILVIGGYTDKGPTSLVEAYDPKLDRWTKKNSMPTPRGFLGLAKLDQKVYAIAGRVREDVGPVECYKYVEDLWMTMHSFPHRRNRFGISTIEDTVYILGGEEHPRSLYIGELQR